MPTGAYSSVACYMNTHLHCCNQYFERCQKCCEQATTSTATGKAAAARLCQEAQAEQDAQDVDSSYSRSSNYDNGMRKMIEVEYHSVRDRRHDR